MRIKSLQGLYLLGIILLLGVALVLSHTTFILAGDFFGYWVSTYIIIAVIIFLKLKEGIIYHPLVLVGLGYFLLLIIGSLTYVFFKDRPLNIYVFNLVGIGFSALMGGILLGDLFGAAPLQSTYSAPLYNVKLIYVLAVVGVVASLSMFVKFKGIPMLAANPNEAKVNFLGGNGVIGLFFKGLPVYSLALLYERYYNGKTLYVAHIYCGVMMVIILAAGYRSTTLISLGEYVCLYLILTKKKLPLKAIAFAGFTAILFLSLWGAYRRGNDGVDGMFYEFDIVINARPVMFETILHNFKEENFFWGSTYYTDFERFLPGTQVISSVDLKYAIFTNPEAMPEHAGVTPSLPGEAYMNFGQKGVYWVLLTLGLFLGFFYRNFQAKPNFLRTATFLTLVFAMADAVQTGIGLKAVHLVQFWVWAIFIGIMLDTRIVLRKKFFYA